MLNLSVDISGPLAGIEKLLGDDLPFTIARFLTMCAQEGQTAARDLEKSTFRLRNDWTTRNTKITPATKTSLLSQVYTDTENRATGAPDYLPRQEEGGEKVPLAGHRFLAIPTRYLRRVAPGIIPDGLRPRNLLPPGANLGETYLGNFRQKGVRPRRAIGKETRAALETNHYAAFVQKTKGGTLCIFVRYGGMRHTGNLSGNDAEPWYTLVPDAHLKPIFPMEQLVQAAVEAGAEKNFDRAAAEVLVNNALDSGFRVRF